MSNARDFASRVPVDGALSNRNLIINGAMQVAQRGTSSTLTNLGYEAVVDRFPLYQNSSGTITVSQETDAPSGFANSLKVTINTGSAPSAGANQLNLTHPIEGYNIASLGLGTSDAKQFTVGFWVKCSLTGDFAIAFQSQSAADYYVASYTVNAANVWEYKTVTIAGKTTGTWNTTNLSGLRVIWDLGTGTNFEAAANSWGAGNKFTFSGATKLVSTTGATLQLTGVQLEVGDTATPFEHRSYGDELARCKRYYEKTYVNDHIFSKYNAGACYGNVSWEVEKRSSPSVSITGNWEAYGSGAGSQVSTNLYNQNPDKHGAQFYIGIGSYSSYFVRRGTPTAGSILVDAEL